MGVVGPPCASPQKPPKLMQESYMLSEKSESGEPVSPAAQAKIFVKDLQDKQVFNTIFLARDKVMLTGKNGKSYISVFLADSSGAVDARIWDNVDAFGEAFQTGDIVRVKGLVQIFQNRRQVIIHRLERAQADEYRMDDFVSTARRQPEDMLAELVRITEGMQNGSIRQLTLEVLNDPEIRRRLLVAAAAKSIHHAYIGGLLEHVLSICGMMKLLHAHYALQQVELNLDFLIFGAIFHDIGKIWELDVSNGISYTDRGKLIGHMVMAVELVEKKASRILGFPDDLKDLLKHIILSHHGRLEYGSPKTPMFLEAFLVAAIDDLDSKINTIDTFVRNEREATSGSTERWSKFNQLFERYFLLR
jgi:3'-5' exoribonuclease